jgi:hypothetical protein
MLDFIIMGIVITVVGGIAVYVLKLHSPEVND